MPTTTKLVRCMKCEGRGVIEHLAHVDDGVCFACEGTGVTESKPARPLPPPSVDRLERMRLDLRALYRNLRDGHTTWAHATDGEMWTEENVIHMIDHVPGSREAFRALGCPV